MYSNFSICSFRIQVNHGTNNSLLSVLVFLCVLYRVVLSLVISSTPPVLPLSSLSKKASNVLFPSLDTSNLRFDVSHDRALKASLSVLPISEKPDMTSA
jgi:hypothetical protein